MAQPLETPREEESGVQAFLLDATVYSDLTAPKGADVRLLRWLEDNVESCFTCPVLTMHMESGVSRLEARGRPGDRERAQRLRRLHARFLSRFSGRFLIIKPRVFKLAGDILGRARLQRQSIEESDCLLAALAISREMTVVTRNVFHFEVTGAAYLDTTHLPGPVIVEPEFGRTDRQNCKDSSESKDATPQAQSKLDG